MNPPITQTMSPRPAATVAYPTPMRETQISRTGVRLFGPPQAARRAPPSTAPIEMIELNVPSAISSLPVLARIMGLRVTALKLSATIATKKTSVSARRLGVRRMYRSPNATR